MKEINSEQPISRQVRLQREVRKQTVGYIVGALSLVAGLAWNDAIKALIEYIFPLDKSGLWVKFLYAAVLTFVVILFTIYIVDFLNPKDGSEE
ncbi:MAG: DUF5654 family protein [Patescibacteria group bacterium]